MNNEFVKIILLQGRVKKSMFRRRGLKVNVIKNKVMVLGGEEEMEREVCVNRMRLEQLSEF